jgi:hypothetical protein
MNASNDPAAAATVAPWPADVSAGEALAGADLGEMIGLPGRVEVLGNIEIRQRRGVSWLLIREDEGLALAAHRALDLYLAEKGEAAVRVLRKTDHDTMLETGKEWELAVCFMARKPKAPRG